jgi:hypothetical protein
MPFLRCPIRRWHGDKAMRMTSSRIAFVGSRQRASVAARSGFARLAVHDYTQPVSLQVRKSARSTAALERFAAIDPRTGTGSCGRPDRYCETSRAVALTCRAAG